MLGIAIVRILSPLEREGCIQTLLRTVFSLMLGEKFPPAGRTFTIGKVPIVNMSVMDTESVPRLEFAVTRRANVRHGRLSKMLKRRS